jgi:undecaprenyl-diphosphatase
LLITVVLAVPKLRRRGGAIAREVGSDLRAFATSGRVLRLLVLSFALTFAYGACLYFALLAVGLAPAIAHVLLVSIAGEGVGSAAPTPGGVGAVEAAMVSGLVIFGVPTAAAIAAVLIYRAMSFWLPIVPGFLAFQRLGTKGDI